jgi:hypothetical protein
LTFPTATAPERGCGIVGEGEQLVVPGENLRPVGFGRRACVVVQGCDRGLDLVLTPPISCEG